MKFSLVIPCYNEAANLPLLLPRCAEVAAQPNVEVVLVDNGSTDSSADVLADLLPKFPGCRSVRVEQNQGYGFGILSGLRAAEGDILGWTHADMQTDPADTLEGLKLFVGGDPDMTFVKGQRYGRPLADTVFTIGMSLFETVLLRQRLWDINAQPTMFSRRFFEGLKNPPHDFSLDLFAYCSARRAGMTVRRFPVRFGERAHGASHWNVDWKSKVNFIRRTVDYSLRLRHQIGAGVR